MLLDVPPKQESRQKLKPKREDVMLQMPIFDNLKNLLDRKDDNLKTYLEQKGAGKYYNRFSSFGVSGVEELRRLSIEDFNYLRIPGNVQSKLSSFHVKSLDLDGVRSMHTVSTSTATETQDSNMKDTGIQTGVGTSVVTRSCGEIMNSRKTQKGNMTRFQKENVYSRKLETITENLREGGDTNRTLDPVVKENWFNSIGEKEFNIFEMFSPKKKKKTVLPKIIATQVKRVESKIACYNCFTLINLKIAIQNEHNSTQNFCSIQCKNQSNLENKEICSICLIEKSKYQMEMCFGEFICKSVSCRKILKTMKRDFSKKKFNHDFGALESNFDNIFNF
jgi:aminoglycoside N3'-acetyltransferase